MRHPHAIIALAALLSPPASAELGAGRAALVDGTHVIDAPATSAAALLAVADDGVDRQGAYICSAVLVAPTVALTAAHCVVPVEADAAAEGWQLDWWLSFADDVTSIDGPRPVLPPRTVIITEVVAHPRFDFDARPRSDRPDTAHDLAVLRLAGPAPAPATPIARPSAALTDAYGRALDDGAPVIIAGYGSESVGDTPSWGRRHAGPSRLIALGARELRVGRRGEVDAPVPPGLAEKCGRDSGGPTWLSTADGWRVIGLTSRAFAGDDACAVAGIDTRVDAYAGWIDAVTTPTTPAGCAAAPGSPSPPSGWLALALSLAALGCRRR